MNGFGATNVWVSTVAAAIVKPAVEVASKYLPFVARQRTGKHFPPIFPSAMVRVGVVLARLSLDSNGLSCF